MILQRGDCSPPVPDSMLSAPSHIMDTEAPIADQNPPTEYVAPAASGLSSAAHAAHHDSGLVTRQNAEFGQDSFFLGDHGLSFGADGVAPSAAVFTSSPRSLSIALSFCQQYQQLQVWQLQHQYQQQAQVQDSNSPIGDGSTYGEGCAFGQSYSQYLSSPVPSQDPPTGYPTACAGFDDIDASTPCHGWTLLKPHSNARLDKECGGNYIGDKFQLRFEDAPEAMTDLGAASRRLQHECSCFNTPVPSQDPPSEHSEAEDDGCSFAGGSGYGACRAGQHMTAPPSPAYSQEASPETEEEDGNSGSYADDAVGDAPPSPVPSQDAPSEYPDPVTPASSAEESEAECSAELSDLSREPLPPGVEISETHAPSPGDLSAGMSHASFHHAVGEQPLKANSCTGTPYDVQRSWWENLEEQSSLDCVWDDYESGDESVGSPCRV